MTDPTTLPLALYQANLDLQQRIGELLQSGGRHWLELGQRLASDGIVGDSAGLQDLIASGDWQKLAALPADTFWRQVQQRFGDQQAAAQIAVAAQSGFTHGLQEALARWQHETIAALDQAGFGLAAPAIDAQWTVRPGVAPATRPAPAKATPRKPAAKKAAVKKAGTKKAATKKAAAGSAAKPAARKAAKKAPGRSARKATRKRATR
jgi:hypothetical protein